MAAGVSLSLRSLRREFIGGVVAIENLDLDIPAGEFLSILGPSGCGKSTLLRLIAGLDHPSSGTVCVGGSISAEEQTAYVFQDSHLLPWRNVLDNVALPLELAGINKKSRRQSARAAIEKVGLADAIDRFPAELSGGMRMRVSLARAWITAPKLLLLDEPFAALDEITRQHLDDQLLQLWKRDGMTILFVTHSAVEAAYLAQKALILTSRPARLVDLISLDLPENRDANLRGQAIFATEVQRISTALRRGGA